MDSTKRDGPEHTAEEGSATAGATSQGCSTRTLSDLPATEDKFGPHERVAQALAELIQSPTEEAKTVALEGGWGSGKSTVVTLLRSKLAGNDKIEVSLFDAWTHRGDPLRRTFLETLIDSLDGWLRDRNKWKLEKKKMSGRLRVTTSQETPRLTPLGMILGAALLSVPVGLAIAGFVSAFTLLESRRWLAITGGIVAGLPLLLLSIFVLLLLVAWPWPRLRRILEAVLGEGPGQALALLAGRTVTETESRTYESPDPTSVEFAATFRELMGEVLAGNDRRLVLVLDNLDRVDADDALAIWSSMQAFLQQSEHSKPDWLDRLWILVPYDPDGIRRVWRSAAETRKFNEAQDPGEERERINREYALTNAFLDKTFQVRFEVPPPVLSDWQSYLSEQLAHGMPDHDKAEVDTVPRVLSLHNDPTWAPSPRDLKIHVNQIGALHRQVSLHDLSLATMSYYVILRREQPDVPGFLRTGTIPAVIEALLGADANVSLARLWFNTDAARAQELLLSVPILDAIRAGDGSRLNDVYLKSRKGFWPVLDNAAERGQLRLNDPNNVLSAAKCFSECDAFARPRSAVAERTVSALSTGALTINSWARLDSERGDALAVLIELTGLARDLIANVLQAAANSEITADGGEQETADVRGWVGGIAALLARLASGGVDLNEVVIDSFEVPGGAAGWIAGCDEMRSSGSGADIWMRFRPGTEAQASVDAIASVVPTGQFDAPHVSAVLVSNRVLPDVSWDALANAVDQRLQSTEALPVAEIDRLIWVLIYLRSNDRMQGVATGLVQTGHAYHHLHQLLSEKAEASRLARFIHFVGSAGPALSAPPDGVGNATAGHNALIALLSAPANRPDVVTEFVNQLGARHAPGIAYALAEGNEAAVPFVKEVIGAILEKNKRAIEPNDLISRWQLVKRVLAGDTLKDVICQLCKDGGLRARLMEEDFNSDFYDLYELTLRCAGKKKAALRKWLVEALDAIPQDQWKEHLSQLDGCVKLLIALQVSGKVGLGLAFKEALIQHVRSTVDGAAQEGEMVGDWESVTAAVAADRIKLLREDLLAAAIQAGGGVKGQFFRFYGDIITSAMIHGAGEIIHKLFWPLIEQKNSDGIHWMADRIEADPALVVDHPNKARVKEFTEKLATALDAETDEGIRPAMQRIASAVGVVPDRSEGSTPA